MRKRKLTLSRETLRPLEVHRMQIAAGATIVCNLTINVKCQTTNTATGGTSGNTNTAACPYSGFLSCGGTCNTCAGC
jgi:hypothetical protein